MDPLPVDAATERALDEALFFNHNLLANGVNAAAVFSATTTISIARAPQLWQAASADAPDLILTINPAWWHSLRRDDRASALLQAVQRVSATTSKNALGRREVVIHRERE